jgi:hypothetical protein
MADDLVKGYHSERRMSCQDRSIGPIKMHEYELQESGRGFPMCNAKDLRGGVRCSCVLKLVPLGVWPL